MPGSLLEPDFKRLVPCPRRDRRSYRVGEVFLNASCAAGSDFGCCGRKDNRRKPSAASCLQTLRSCSATPNSVFMRCCRSRRRQHTTPSRTGTVLDPDRKLGQLRGCQPPGALRHHPVHQPGEAFRIVAMPVRRGNCPPDSFLIRLTSASGGSSRRSAPPLCGQRPPEPTQSPASAARPASPSSCPQPREAPSPSTPAA